MTWLDFVVILLCVAGGVLEARRGLVCGVLDLAGIALSVHLASSLHTGLADAIGVSHLTAYIALLLALVAAVVVLSTVADALLKWDAGGIEAVAGGFLGLIAGYLLAHGVVGLFIVGWGEEYAAYSGSLLAKEVYNFSTYHAVLTALRNLGTGPRVVDQVK